MRHGRLSLVLSLHGSSLIAVGDPSLLAVGDPSHNSDSFRFTSGTPPIRIDLLPIPTPIHINAVLLPLTLTVHACTLELIIGTAALTKEGKCVPAALARATENLLPPLFKRQLYSFQKRLTEANKRGDNLDDNFEMQMDFGPYRPNSDGQTDNTITVVQEPNHIDTSIAQTSLSPNSSLPPQDQPAEEIIQFLPPPLQNPTMAHESHPSRQPASQMFTLLSDSLDNNIILSEENCESAPEPPPREIQHSSQLFSALDPTQAAPLSIQHLRRSKGKERLMPLRRSERIQAKKSSDSVSFDSSNKKKKQQAELPFDLHSRTASPS